MTEIGSVVATDGQSLLRCTFNEDEIIILGEALAAFPEEHIAALEATRENIGDGVIAGVTIEPVAEIVRDLTALMSRMLDMCFAINEADKHRPLLYKKGDKRSS